MKTLALVAVLALASGCNKAPTPSTDAQKPTAAEAAVKELSITEVSTALKEKQVVAVDANGIETRQKYGVVPGAILLSDHNDYALSELPKDKATSLVFYCGGTACRASDTAASRAQSAGYAKVSVMREGIRGWSKAGQPTEMAPKS